MKFSLLTIGGSHPRHLYFLNKIAQIFKVSGSVIQQRENIVPLPPEGLAEQDRVNFIRHFADRDRSEAKYFGDQTIPSHDVHLVAPGTDVSGSESAKFVEKIKPDLVLVFGSGMIRSPLFDVLKAPTINMHLGLSPRYRGAATLFWPFYFLEPQFAGATFHQIVYEPDAGGIVHQVCPELQRGDGIHDVACRTVLESTDQALSLLEVFAQKKEFQMHKQKGTGKNFLASDFRAEHLRLVYDLYQNQIVDQYLDGHFGNKLPKLVRQF